MIKNFIFDVGMVLVNWDPHAAFQELGFDEKTEEAVGNATVYSDAWNESDRSVLDAEEQLAVFVQNAPEYEKEIRLFARMDPGAETERLPCVYPFQLRKMDL